MLRLSALFGMLLVGVACQTPVTSSTRPALAERGPLRLVAVAPLRLSQRLQTRTGPSVDPALMAELLAHQMAETLEQRGVRVVPPEDVRSAVPAGDLSEPPQLARQVSAAFGADAVLTGELLRVQQRSGEAAGSRDPAGVGFEVILYGAPDGRELWRAQFDQTQKAWGENVFQTLRYPGGGMRWLTAEELARWGAREVVRAVPVGP
jgi:hypothetical protein